MNKNQKKKLKIFMKNVPPITNRFCLHCEETTQFKYNILFQHSECVKCGNRLAISPEEKDEYFKNKKEVIKRILDKTR